MSLVNDVAQQLANILGRRVEVVTLDPMPSVTLPDARDPDAMKQHYADFCSSMTVEHIDPVGTEEKI